MIDWKLMAESYSLHNTPPCFAVYMCSLVFEHLKQRGGLAKVEQDNIESAQRLYQAVDKSGGFYQCPQDPEVRSNMNIPFTIGDAELEKKFIKEAAERNMVQLKGHRSVGGMRASIYNAMPTAGINKLIAFMDEFQKANA
jgi:phosphoserine aminotransferase